MAAITIDPANFLADFKAFQTKAQAIVAAAAPVVTLVEVVDPAMAPELRLVTAGINVIANDGPAIVEAINKLIADVETALKPA